MSHTRSTASWWQAAVLSVVIVVSMLVGGVLAVTVAGNDDNPAPATTAEQTSLPVSTATGSNGSTPTASAAFDDLPGLVEQVRPSVVVIETVVGGGIRQGEGLGTGVVADKQGHILTNFHVVDGASQVTVTFSDGTSTPGTVVGSDQGNDLAVVKVSMPEDALTPAKFGDSDLVKAGESVFAIGNPFSLKYTVTSGIVSATDRESQDSTLNGRRVRGMIQTDAAVNPGNSGGPLFNANGEVIGINTSIENPTGQRVFVGVGFAVPSNTALRYLPDMIEGRPITHAQLGVSGVTLNGINAQQAGVDVEQGVYITSVTAGSAAAAAGLRAAPQPISNAGELVPGGDVVTAIDGTEVHSIEQLAKLVDQHDVGDQVTLTIVRDGQETKLTVTLQEWTG